jgi:TolB protein
MPTPDLRSRPVSSLRHSPVARPRRPSAPRPATTLVLAFAFVALTAALPVSAQNKPGGATFDIGTVRGAGRQQIAIALPAFLPGSGSASQLPVGSMATVIGRDLGVTGQFKIVGTPTGLDATHRAWLARKNDFAPWTRAGAKFFLTATYRVDSSGALQADAYLFDAASGQQVFGQRYAGFTAAMRDRLSHQIADDILRYLTGEEGISGTYLLYVSTRSGTKEVFAMDANGGNQRQLTDERSLVTAPAWGMSGTEIYYTSYARYNPDLVGLKLADRSRWVISQYSGNNISPDWSEKAQRIALIMGRDGNQELYSIDRAGRSPKRLTQTRLIESSPSWSPDGRRITFVSNRGGGPQIYIMNADGSGTERISFNSSYCTSPAWSPEGRYIAYTARAGRQQEIFVLDLTTRQAVRLSDGKGNSEDPTWSPDGKYLAFSNDRSGRFHIYRVRIDGSGLTQLTQQGENTSPAWSPVLR